MMLPLSGLSQAIRRWLPRELVRPDAYARCEELFRSLPAVFTWGCFETRLGSDEGTDFLACILASHEAHRRVRSALASGAPWASELDDWERARRFLEQWSSSEAPAEVPFVWLEFDLGDRARARPLLFACCEPRFHDGARYGAETAELRSRRVATRLAELDASLGTSALASRLRELTSALGPRSRLPHLAVVRTNARTRLRAVVFLPRDAWRSELAAIGWRGPLGELEALVAAAGASGPHQGFHLDLDEGGLGASIALQVFRDVGPNEDPRAWRVFDYLEAAGVCSSDERGACAAWVGSSTEPIETLAWPCALDRGLELKVGVAPDGALSVKAYLGFHTGLAFTRDPATYS